MHVAKGHIGSGNSLKRMKKVFKRKSVSNKLHLYFGLILALPLLLICVTGAMLSFQEEFCHVLYPKHYQNNNDTEAASLSTEQILLSLSKDKAIQRVFFPNKSRETLAIMFVNEDDYCFYNSKTGSYQDRMHNLRGVFKPALVLHRTFFWKEGGNALVGLIAFLFWLVILISGLVLFIPRYWSVMHFKIRLRAFSFTTHRVLGIVFIIPLFSLAVSGNYFTYSEPYNLLIDLFTSNSPDSQQNRHQRPKNLEDTGNAMLSINQIYEQMKAVKDSIPSNYQFSYIMRSSGNELRAVSCSFEDFESITGIPDRYQIAMHPQTGALFSKNIVAEYTDKQVVRSSIVYYHMGKIAGWPLKLLWCLSGLAGVWFCISGIRIWWLKRGMQ